MNVEIGTEAPIFLFWEYLFQIFGILPLQCGCKYLPPLLSSRLLILPPLFLTIVNTVFPYRLWLQLLSTIIISFAHSCEISSPSSTLCKENPLYVFPEKKLLGISPNFHIDVSVSDLYTPTIGPPFFTEADRSWEYINRSPKHECRNWERGRAVSFLEIFVSNVRYSIFAVPGYDTLPPLSLTVMNS
jgi:hypothetical protein